MPLKFQNTSTGGGGGESLAETLVIGNTTGPEDIIQTDASVFRCNDENGLQFASTGGETHTNGGTTFSTLFNTNQFHILDLAAKALFFIRSLSSKLYLKIGDATLGNGAVFVVDDNNNRSYIDNVAHDIKVGINKAAPTVALDVVGSAKIRIPFGSALLDVDNSIGFISLGDYAYDFNAAYIYIDQASDKGIKIQSKNSRIIIGDEGTGNDTKIIVTDTDQQIQFQGLHLNYIGLQDFANNAAAITGGLSTGDLYYTNSGGSAVIKIVV